jgi:purine-cytosine permease-like protein
MSTVGNGSVGVSGTGPVSGYNLELSRLFAVFFLFLHKLSVNTNKPYEAIILLNNIMICLVIFGIKIYRKMPKILTIQKLITVIGFRSLVLLLRLSQMFLTDQITNNDVIE